MLYKGFTDGSVRGYNPGRAAWAWVLFLEDGTESVMRDAACIPGINTNNHAEYRAVINLLRWWKFNRVEGDSLLIHCDSELVVKQLRGEYSVSDTLYPLFHQAMGLKRETGADIIWVRGHSGILGNEMVDQLANKVQDERDDATKQQLGWY